MNVEVKVAQNPHDTRKKVFATNRFEFDEGMTVLVGPNGSGKSTLLREVEKWCHKKKQPVLFFSAEGARERNKTDSMEVCDWDLKRLCRSLSSSEGENILLFMEKVCGETGALVRHKAGKPCWVLLDSLDSGASVDTIRMVRDVLDSIVADTREKSVELRMLVAANQYELARNATCVVARTGETRTFDSYEEYRQFILDRSDAFRKWEKTE